jgi:hypothetical protein
MNRKFNSEHFSSSPPPSSSSLFVYLVLNIILFTKKKILVETNVISFDLTINIIHLPCFYSSSFPFHTIKLTDHWDYPGGDQYLSSDEFGNGRIKKKNSFVFYNEY